MQRAPLIAKLLCVGLVAPLCGCSLFGIDTREGIEYVTVNQRKSVKEPMYTRSMPGTNLVKRWPSRLGVDYGYMPWELKRDPQAIAAQPVTSSASAMNPASTAPANPALKRQAAPGATVAEHWQGRGDTVQRANAEIAVGHTPLPSGGATASATDRTRSIKVKPSPQPLQSQSTAMSFDPMLPYDQTVSPSYVPDALPTMTEERPPVVVGGPNGLMRRGTQPMVRQGGGSPRADGIQLKNPLRRP